VIVMPTRGASRIRQESVHHGGRARQGPVSGNHVRRLLAPVGCPHHRTHSCVRLRSVLRAAESFSGRRSSQRAYGRTWPLFTRMRDCGPCRRNRVTASDDHGSGGSFAIIETGCADAGAEGADLCIEGDKPAAAIAAVTGQLGADLVVIGRSTGAALLRRGGTKSYDIARQASCPGSAGVG
jgi:hypothetical protein